MASKNDMLQDLLYGDMLTTPGYEVEFAVGTTFSLDMNALLIVPYSLGMFGDLGEKAKASPLVLLESIRRSSSKFVLYCHRGGIHVPKDVQVCHPLLENSIVEVTPPTALSNFHPKMWVIREHRREDKDDKQIKVVIMSKNITFDNNLDVAASLTGKINTEHSANSKRHKPLKDMLDHLATYSKGKQRREVEKLADDLHRVKRFEVDCTRFEPDGYEFVPFWFGDNLNPCVPFPEAFQGLSTMVISPFIDTDTIACINKCKRKDGQHVLVTRSGYVSEEIFNQYRGEHDGIYVMNDQMVNNDYTCIDLHAKMYFVSWPKSEDGYFLYLGSANATQAAFHANTEILLRLKYKNGQLLLDKFKKEFLQQNDREESDVYERVEEPNEHVGKHEYSNLEVFVRKLLAMPFKAVVSEAKGNGLYDVSIKAKASASPYGMTIAPLQLPAMAKPLGGNVLFEDIPKSKLSEFYVIKGMDGEELVRDVIKIPTTGIPTDRDDEIFRSIVDSKDKFYDYVSFMLCDDPGEFAFELEQAEKMASSDNHPLSKHQMPIRIYEQMLQLASHNPEQLLEMDDVLNKVKHAGYSQSFRTLYEQFKQVMPQLKKMV